MFKIGNHSVALLCKNDNSLNLFVKLNDVNSVYEYINEQPVFPEWREKIEKMVFYRAIQGTVALEGSDLEIDDVERIAQETEPITTDQDKEGENALNAYDFIKEWSMENPDAPITEAVIKQLHTYMTRDISYYLNEPGLYRNQPVEFGYPKKRSELVDRFQVEEVMARLIEYINSDGSKMDEYSSHPLTKAIAAHYFLTYIHPFIDGNGRVSRAVEALILYHYGAYESYLFPISAGYYYSERKKYFEHLRGVDASGDLLPFIEFALDGLSKNLFEIKKDLMDAITSTLIMDYAHQLRRGKNLLKRQTELLQTMLYCEPVTAREFREFPPIRGIYSRYSKSTVKRDLKKLSDYNFLKYIEVKNEQGKLLTKLTVNWDVLRGVRLRRDRIPHRPST